MTIEPKTLPTSVYYEKDKRRRKSPYRVRINHDGKAHHVGRFSTLDEAVTARDKYLNSLPSGSRKKIADRHLVTLMEYMRSKDFKFREVAEELNLSVQALAEMLDSELYIYDRAKGKIYKEISAGV